MPVDCATLGLFILDTFEWRILGSDGTVTSTKREEGVLGGGGLYAMIGSRVWLPAERVGILVDRGTDWPKAIEEELVKYGKEMWVFRDKPDEPTTRALNLYTGEHRDFKYLTPRKRLEPKDLPSPLRTSRVLHFVCSPTRAVSIQSQLQPPLNPTPDWAPQLIYEPIPDRCIPEEMPSLRQILPNIRVFSPNHEEAWSFFGVGPEEVARRGKQGIEEVAQRFFEEGARSIVVIRSGALGAYALRKGDERGVWVPAYHVYQPGGPGGKVLDVTGAGNSFLGGLMAGLVLHPHDLVTAVQCASVSASFVIEQFGLPSVELGEDGIERWNGVDPTERLAEMRERQ
ncbi:pfkB family carbohydrate kinase [Rhodotorula toruloides]|uniref:PfkB family carbohydrate kinase n=1 Tax=Rhodotorula toruloides TaxID=5286 RepID=A0A511KHT0_RHOTO|nr:pfkB family carbohydrate kinase [Rhodotorula toruloides]